MRWSKEVPIPPLRLQNKFEKMLTKTYSVKEKLYDISQDQNDLFNALNGRALRGEL